MTNKPTPNKWKDHHDFLERSNLHTGPMEEIMRLCRWSRSTFYRYLRNPGTLSISDRLTICSVYQILPDFLFPGTEVKAKTA